MPGAGSGILKTWKPVSARSPPDPEGRIGSSAAVTGERPGEALSVVFAVRPHDDGPAARVDRPSLGGKMSGQRYHIAVRGQFDQHLPSGNAELHRRLPLPLLTGFVLSGLLVGCDVGGRLVRHIVSGRLVRHIPPPLGPRAPALRPDGRSPVTADVVPREHLKLEHLTRHLRDLISRSGAGGVPDDLVLVPAGLYLIAEAAAQFTGKPLLGHQLGQVTRRNADTEVVAQDA